MIRHRSEPFLLGCVIDLACVHGGAAEGDLWAGTQVVIPGRMPRAAGVRGHDDHPLAVVQPRLSAVWLSEESHAKAHGGQGGNPAQLTAYAATLRAIPQDRAGVYALFSGASGLSDATSWSCE